MTPFAHNLARPRAAARRPRRGFTMLEVLLSMFILAIGLIMVASIFPVAADWTRQNTEESLASNIAMNAVGIIQTKLALADMAGVTPTVGPLPAAALAKLPIGDRAYNFGANPPYPAAVPAKSLYYWTAEVKQSSQSLSRFDLYIFVFKKGEAAQNYNDPNIDGLTRGAGETSVPGLSIGLAQFSTMPVGAQGVGITTGSVFRLIGPNSTTTQLMANENIIYAPPADGTTSSPLVYIYQTTVSF